MTDVPSTPAPMPPPGGPDPEWDGEAAAEAVRKKVQAILLRESEISLDQQGRVIIDRGSTRVFINFFPQPERKVVYVTLTSPVAYYVPITPGLFEHIAREADKWYFGHLAMSPYADDTEHAGSAYVYFTYSLVGDFLDPDELTIPVFAVLNTAAAIDDDIVAKFGGEMFRT